MASLSFLLLKATSISYLCTTLSLALPSGSYFPQNATSIWKNDELFPDTVHFSDGSLARFILARKMASASPDGGYGFGFCFYCNSQPTYTCYLSIAFIEIYHDQIAADTPPMIVWTANRDKPVGENSVLIFSVGGALALKDSKGHPIWSTDSSQSFAFAMSLNYGNLVLLNQTNVTVWQSFDHPTNTLVGGQMLKKGQQLTSSISSVDMGSGLFYLSLEHYYLSANATGKNTYNYLQVFPATMNSAFFPLTHIQFEDGNVIFYYQGQKGQVKCTYETPVTTDFELLILDADGGLKLYGWDIQKKWWLVYYFSNGLQWDECQFPLKCGRYGLCQNGQCVCPVQVDGTALFAPSDSQHPSRGCHQIIDSQGLKGTEYSYELRSFGHLSYFSYYDAGRAAPGLDDEDSCKQSCLRNGTSCMAAFFYYVNATSQGFCYLVEDVLSISGTPMSNDDLTSLYLKVKISSTTNVSLPVPTLTTPFYKSRTLPIVLATCGLVLLCTFISLLLLKRKKIHREKLYLKRLSDTLLRFSFSELSIYTQSFSNKLGGGGFGLVFKGTLEDGREVAVKRLEPDGQGKKEFLAEVETVGKIHHFNLVNLIGFCIENKHMIIVYEYVANGSLDKWIFYPNQNTCLDWKLREKIVLGVAKGLAYIHEECRQRIAHLDIKPHNILLDDNFNAKISDFGMSKLINRDESQVMTGMRGTLGYLAPEWQGLRITVKADAYSFGILVLEVVSGRKVLDYLQPESGVHLLKLLKKKSLENRIMDIVDSRCEDMVSNSEDVVNLIRLAMRCLHSDYKRRPAMSIVVKVLEGSSELEPNFTYNFSSIFSPVRSDSNT